MGPVITTKRPITGVALIAAPDFMVSNASVRTRLGLEDHDADQALLMYVATGLGVDVWLAGEPAGPWQRVDAASPVLDMSGLVDDPEIFEDDSMLTLGRAEGSPLLRDIDVEVDEDEERIILYFGAAGNGRRVLRDAGTGDVPVSTWAVSSATGLDFGTRLGTEPDDVVAQVVGPRGVRRFDVDGLRYALSAGGVVSAATWHPLIDTPRPDRRDAAWISAASERNTVLDDAIDELVTGPIPRPDPERDGVLASIPSVAVLGGAERSVHVLFTVESDRAPVPGALEGINVARLDAGSATWWNWRPITDATPDGDAVAAVDSALAPEHGWEGSALRLPAVVALPDGAVLAYVSEDGLHVGIAMGDLP